MTAGRELRAKANVLEVLRRVGVREETIHALDAALDDPVDLTRDAGVFVRYGITRDRLFDWMGASP